MARVVPFLVILLVFALLKKLRDRRWGRCSWKGSLVGRVVVITGGNGGVGKEVVKGLVARGATVIMGCRRIGEACRAIVDIRRTVSTGEMVPMELDLASFDSIKKFAALLLKTQPKIHVLINNAGVFSPADSKQRTQEGFELNFGVNYLGHFLLTNLLLKRIKESEPSRIVIVSSGQHRKGRIDLDDLNLDKRELEWDITGTANVKYSASKLANVYHCRELSERLRHTGVQVYSVSPGLTCSGLFCHVKWWQLLMVLPVAIFISRTPEQGAQSILHCAIEEDLDGKSGDFFRNCRKCKPSLVDPYTQKTLWDISEKLIDQRN